ncbi:hypothetical protein ACQVDT_33640 [Streptomyces sp. RMIT01]
MPAPRDLTGFGARGSVLVAAFAHPAHAELARLDELCAGFGLRWLPLRRERGRALLGRAVTSGVTADFTDVLERRLAAAPGPRVVAAVRDADGPAGAPPCGRERPGGSCRRWDWRLGRSRNKVAVPEGAAGSPPF